MNPMVSINTWSDVSSFAGCIVAYEENHGRFFSITMRYGEYATKEDCEAKFTFKNSPETCFGVISNLSKVFSNDQEGFTLNQFLKSDSVIIYMGFTDRSLKETSLKIRFATPQEVDLLNFLIPSRCSLWLSG